MRHDDHDHGLAHDLEQLRVQRRQVLKLLAGAGLFSLLGCPSSGSSGSSNHGDTGDTNNGDTDAEGGTCAQIPEETAGPYPGDGSNGKNALTVSGIVRSDMRSSVGGLTGTAAGIPLKLKIKLSQSNANCATLAGYAIYLWHCDRDGKYSMYDLTDQNYLRGVQETDDEGYATFTTIFPGCYAGRMPHMHFEVYPSVSSATGFGNKLATSQIAFPEATCKQAYASSGYERSVSNFASLSFARDNVFSDGYASQLATMTGSAEQGYEATLSVAIAD